MAITPSSKHKEDALRVIEVTVSDEVQKALSADGQIMALKSEAVKAALGSDKPYLRTKIFKASSKARRFRIRSHRSTAAKRKIS